MWGTVPDFRRGPKRQTKGVRNRPPALFFRHLHSFHVPADEHLDFWWSLDFLAAGVSQLFFATDKRNNTVKILGSPLNFPLHFVSLAMRQTSMSNGNHGL
jgi:hypothetical protein